ncbi:MAG TPA: DUF72 domain-containing protein [Hyphomicrobiales bacterium]|nr:DUF72 domain-containing protein [Hyphomicrobiales bacterium]
MSGTIRVGIGGWTFAPWRGTFYPADLPQKDELAYASRQLTAIEINGTYYRTQSPASFRKWADETPDDFVFSVKALRFCTNRRVLAEAGESVGRFVNSGLAALGDKLGPILWQFAPTKRFEPEDFAAFLALLPEKLDGRRLRHAVEVRHDSFVAPDFVALLRKFGVAAVLAHSEKYPLIADPTADFVYARLQGTEADLDTGYAASDLDAWAARAKALAAGELAGDLPALAEAPAVEKRDVFVFMISGAKVRAPAAATALIERVGRPG